MDFHPNQIPHVHKSYYNILVITGAGRLMYDHAVVTL